jgi:hypothetical protein
VKIPLQTKERLDIYGKLSIETSNTGEKIMFWHRTLKLTGTFIGYGFGAVGGAIGATFLAAFCLGAMHVEYLTFSMSLGISLGELAANS